MPIFGDATRGAVEGLTGPLFNLIDSLFTSDEERAEAKRKLLTEQGQQRLREVQVQLSAILAEAQSEDPWTSRARPSFLYVVYAFILASIPMGFLFAADPVAAEAVTTGVRNWLDAIPDDMWWLFGAGYLGYTGARSFDKRVRK